MVTAYPRNKKDVIIPWIIRLIKILKKKGVETEIFTSSYMGMKNHTDDGIKVKRFRYFLKSAEKLSHDISIVERLKSNSFYFFLLPFFMIFGMISAVLYAKKNHFDIIHVHFPFPLAFFALAMKKVRKVPVVYSFHGSDINLAHRNRFFKKVCRMLISRADHIVVNSSFTAERVSGLLSGDTPLSIIPMGSGGEISKSAKKFSDFSKNGNIRILFAGRLIKLKGVEYLLRALSMLDSRFRLTVAGDGPCFNELKKYAEKSLEDRVDFPGFVSPDKMSELYRKSDIFVLPSIVDKEGFSEGLGTVLIEAMQHRVPVIASHVGGIPDIVENGETGILVPQKNPEKLAEALKKLADDSEFRKKIVEKAEKNLKKRFAWETVAEKHMSCYREVLGKKCFS